jgi:hypothetical protein
VDELEKESYVFTLLAIQHAGKGINVLMTVWPKAVYIFAGGLYIPFSNRNKRHLICFTHFQFQGKGKAIPLLALSGPEGSRRLRLPDFKTIGT